MKRNKYFIILAAAAAAYYLTRNGSNSNNNNNNGSTSTSIITPPPVFWYFVNPQKMRNDSAGLGHFGASRGSRRHRGVDLIVSKNQKIFAPFNGTITRKLQVYGSDPKYKGLEIQSEADKTIKVKVFYCIVDNNLIGKKVQRGQVIATAQAINEKYSTAMKNHIHVELWKSGINKDITPKLNL